MAKKEVAVTPRRWRPYVLPALALTFASLGVVLAFQRTEHFLIGDERFQLRPGVLPGEGSPDLRISGIDRTPASQVRAIFAQDEGRSIYVAPLEERRESLLAIQWVRKASVSRLWPNALDVHIEERVPEAFVRVPGAFHGSASRLLLIDEDGVLLPVPQDRVALDLPALTGIREEQTLEQRSARVRLMQRISAEIGEAAKQVSEFDLTDPRNVRLVYQVNERAVTLVLGDRDFAARVKTFQDHYSEILSRAPDAQTLDLRLPDRITAVEEGTDGK